MTTPGKAPYTDAELERGAEALDRPMVRLAVQPGFRKTIAGAVLDAVLPDHDAELERRVREEIPGWAHEQDVTFDGDTHRLDCCWCNSPVTAIEAGDSLEDILTAARDHHRTCAHRLAGRQHAAPPTTGEDHRHAQPAT